LGPFSDPCTGVAGAKHWGHFPTPKTGRPFGPTLRHESRGALLDQFVGPFTGPQIGPRRDNFGAVFRNSNWARVLGMFLRRAEDIHRVSGGCVVAQQAIAVALLSVNLYSSRTRMG
jgi:hypothetical protein